MATGRRNFQRSEEKVVEKVFRGEIDGEKEPRKDGGDRPQIQVWISPEYAHLFEPKEEREDN